MAVSSGPRPLLLPSSALCVKITQQLVDGYPLGLNLVPPITMLSVVVEVKYF